MTEHLTSAKDINKISKRLITFCIVTMNSDFPSVLKDFLLSIKYEYIKILFKKKRIYMKDNRNKWNHRRSDPSRRTRLR